MPKLPVKAGPLGLAIAAYDLWRRIPKEHRKAIVGHLRKNGPKAAKGAARVVNGARRPR